MHFPGQIFFAAGTFLAHPGMMSECLQPHPGMTDLDLVPSTTSFEMIVVCSAAAGYPADSSTYHDPFFFDVPPQTAKLNLIFEKNCK